MIGNVQHVRVPAKAIQNCSCCDALEIMLDGNTIVLSPAPKARQGWDAAFAAMAEDDRPIIPDLLDDPCDARRTC